MLTTALLRCIRLIRYDVLTFFYMKHSVKILNQSQILLGFNYEVEFLNFNVLV